MSTQPPSEPETLYAGRYAILGELGRGGMGVVHLAEDKKLQRQVAVKRISSELLGEQGADRFFTEARACAQVQSAHVVPVYDYGVVDGKHYMVLEYIDGRSLLREIKKGGSLSVERTRKIGLQLCRGLGAAHAAGVIHRDLKPSNVMLTSRDGDHDFVKILDFGVAKIMGEDRTTPGLVVGTIDYMAPEMVKGEAVDGRADMYALGVLLYRMVTGTKVFLEPSSVPGFHQAFTAPDPVTHRAPDVELPPVFAAAIMRCLEKNPKDRFANMEALAVALDGDATSPERTATMFAHLASNGRPQGASDDGSGDSAATLAPGGAQTAELATLMGAPKSRRPLAVGAVFALMLLLVVVGVSIAFDAGPEADAAGAVAIEAGAKARPIVAEDAAPQINEAKADVVAVQAKAEPAVEKKTAGVEKTPPAKADKVKKSASAERKRKRRSRRRKVKVSNESEATTFKRVRTSKSEPAFKRVRTKSDP